MWAVTGSFSKATTVAAAGGQITGAILTATELFVVMRGSLLEKFWAAIVGWFRYGAARSSRQEAKTLDRMRGFVVRDVMPTVLGLLGQEVPAWVEDHSLVPALTNGAVARRDFVISSFPFVNPRGSIRSVDNVHRKVVWGPVTTVTTAE